MRIAHFLGLMVLASSPVTAVEVVHQLSPEEKAAAIDAASRGPERNPLLAGQTPEAAARDNIIHGEIGFGIGTGGMRSVFGRTFVTLGESGAAAFSFSTGRFCSQLGGQFDGPFGDQFSPWSPQPWPGAGFGRR